MLRSSQRWPTSGEKRSFHRKTPEDRIYEATLVMDLWIHVASSQPSLYKGHMALDPLVRRLGTLGNLRGGVSKRYESQSNDSCRFEDDLGLFLTIKYRLWSARHWPTPVTNLRLHRKIFEGWNNEVKGTVDLRTCWIPPWLLDLPHGQFNVEYFERNENSIAWNPRISKWQSSIDHWSKG
jgi:hypothetical protein